MKKDYFVLALKNIRHKGLRSWLTILGVFIGIAAVVALITMGNGLREAITGQFNTLSTDKLMVQNSGTGFGAPGSTVIKKLTSNDIDIIKKVNGVDFTVSKLLRITKVEFNKNANFMYLTNVPENQKELDTLYESMNIKIQDGKLLKVGESGKVVLGANIANKDSFDKEVKVGDKILINGKSFDVIGTLKTSSSFQVNEVILMDEKDMKDLLGIKDEIDFIIVQVSDPKQTEAVAEKIKAALRKDRHEKLGEETFSVQTPLQAISSVNTVLNIINLIVVGIAAISLIIGGIGIANTMYTSVLERTKEIGIMKAVGAKNKDILYIFVIESGLLGLIGGVIGALLGLAMAFSVSSIANSYFGLEILKVQISYPLVFGSIAFAFFIGLFSGLTPAFQASKLKPVEALRK